VALLKDTLERCPKGLDSLELGDILDSQDTSKLQRAIEIKLNSRASKDNLTIWKKGQKLIERVFVVLFPLAKNLLAIANEGQAVGS